MRSLQVPKSAERIQVVDVLARRFSEGELQLAGVVDCANRCVQIVEHSSGWNAAQQQNAFQVLFNGLLTGPEVLSQQAGPTSHPSGDVIAISDVPETTNGEIIQQRRSRESHLSLRGCGV
jgi:hypothetical protein